MPERTKSRAPKDASVEDVSALLPAVCPMIKPIRVLVLEDNAADTELIRHELLRSGLATVTERVDTEHAFVSALRDFLPDVVLSDHALGAFDAQSALALLHSMRPTTPLILVTGAINSEATVACIRAGAEDLILKDNLGRLAASITKAPATASARQAHAATGRSAANGGGGPPHQRDRGPSQAERKNR
jgi:CheY-like chemotaxis protein